MSSCGHRAVVDLAEEYKHCERCPTLCDGRKHVVFGAGSTSAPILVVGSAPGPGEDDAGVPFIEDAGQLLADLFAKAWPQADEMVDIRNIQEDIPYFEALREYLDRFVFWTNTLLCTLPDGRTEPLKAEIKACADRLHRVIYAVDPVLIVACGKHAASLLVGKSVQITEKHGTIFDITVPSPVTKTPVRYAMVAILDPAFLLRQGDQKLVKKKQGYTYKTIGDLRNAFGLLEQLHMEAYGTSFLERA